MLPEADPEYLPTKDDNINFSSIRSPRSSKTPRFVYKENIDTNETVERIKAEIIAKISKSNPNIGRWQSVTLKAGPRAFKIAIIYQILNAETKANHHLVLTLQTWYYTKSKNQIEEQAQYNITLDTKQSDEIGILRDSITAFIEEVTAEPDTYAVVTKKDYEQLDKYSKKNIQADSIEDLLESEDSYNEIVEVGGLTLFKNVIDWVLHTDKPKAVIDKLQELNIETLKDLNITAGLTQFQKVINIWNDNLDNDNEEFWQKTLAEYSWVISQLFSFPLVLFVEKAYLGGKSILNKGGNIVDFLYKNKVTDNALLVEIKTPMTKLLGGKYRQTYATSDEISGALNQLLNYKKQIQHNYKNLQLELEGEDSFIAINPKTLLIIGSTSELSSKSQVDAFELFRNNSKDIEIITFDELFSKVQLLINLFVVDI